MSTPEPRLPGTIFSTIDAVAGIKTMRFSVNDKVEDQGGVGFALQDSVMYSASSCIVSQTSTFDGVGRIDVAVCASGALTNVQKVRNGVNVTRVFLENPVQDNALRFSVVETDIPPPTQAVAANAAYSIWSITSSAQFVSFNVGAEIDGVKYSFPAPTFGALDSGLSLSRRLCQQLRDGGRDPAARISSSFLGTL
ncbi:hypothetical protein B0H16DRAFT_402013 [Mycena metata]|uniref:Uncharacterized protein n=1 Tax=Mycena metata TaxID=1033252 RepID=A0AAD7JKD4_9AGAR|nr:hypothetical protein B0H16DRAFT_402013 [Mycena metata]